MKLSHYIAISLAVLTLTLHAAIQVTKDYCDRNSEKAVTNALNYITIALPTIVESSVDDYMSENGIPTVTNTIIETFHENVISNNYNNFITNNLYTNTYITNNIHTIESSITNNIYETTYITNNIHTIESSITNNIYETTYITNNIYTVESITNNIYKTRYITNEIYTTETITNEFITTLEKETNTLFTVDLNGILSITKDDKLIWEQGTIASNETTNTFIPIYPKIRNGTIIWETSK